MPSKKKMQGMVWEAAVLHNDREVDRVVIHSVPGIRDHFGMDVETQKKKKRGKDRESAPGRVYSVQGAEVGPHRVEMSFSSLELGGGKHLNPGSAAFCNCWSRWSHHLYNDVHQRMHIRTETLAPNAWPETMRLWLCFETVNCGRA